MKMFRFPTDPERRRRWVAANRREGWQPNNSRICKEHFVKGMVIHFICVCCDINYYM